MNGPGAAAYDKGKAAAHDPIVGLGIFVDLHIVRRIAGIVIHVAVPVGIGDQEAAALELAGGIAEHTDAKTPLLCRGVGKLRGYQCGMGAIYILDIGEIQGIDDRRIISTKGNGSRGSGGCGRMTALAA